MSKNKNHELDKARFSEPFFKNYDLYDTDGKTGPGTGFYEHMSDYKSVADFLKKRKKRKSKKSTAIIKLLKLLTKQAIDFVIDDSIKDPIFPGENNSIETSLPFGGITDKYLPLNDQEDKNPTELDFGEDYQNEDNKLEKNDEYLKEVNPSQSSLLGLPDGMDPDDETADKTISNRTEDYGSTDSGNILYDNISF